MIEQIVFYSLSALVLLSALAVVLHRMWRDETEFRFGKQPPVVRLATV